MKMPLFALVDCNNFFVSCERVFRPDLENKPVVVLSSNDGCVIARSNEAKALNIPMGAPAFKYRQILEQNHVVQFSANFELYGNFSRRITDILTSITPHIEIYSVDESFLDISQLSITDCEAWARRVRANIFAWTGIPVSIGIAPTKTLAKLASEQAKKSLQLQNILWLDPQDKKTTEHLKATAIGNVWGVGWRLAPKLKAEGIHNALDLSQLRGRRAQQLMSVKGRQTVSELQGVSCFGLENLSKKPKSISSTRTFGQDSGEPNVLEAAIARFTAVASFRLRQSSQLTHKAGLFIATNRHKPGHKTRSGEVQFDSPTNDTGALLSNLVDLLARLMKPGEVYHRAGIWLYDFVDTSQVQTDLFGAVNIGEHRKSRSRMQAVDAINNRFGRATIRMAAEELSKSWQPKKNVRSPRYTTEWNELPQAKIW